MEQKETACFNNLLLDNIEIPIDITLVNTPKEVTTPSLLNNSPSGSFRITKSSSSDKSHIAKIEKSHIAKIVTTLLESLDHTFKPFRVKCTS